MESYVRGLETLGQTFDMYGSLLVPVVLPSEVRKSIARGHGKTTLTLEKLLMSISNEIDVLEAGQGRTEKMHADQDR